MNPLLRLAKKTKKVIFTPKIIGTIYVLHRCSPISSQNLYWNEHMKVSPEFLRNFLTEKRNTHEFISLDMLYELSIKKILKKPFIVMTFDDGYIDNYEYVLPIFDDMHIPFAVYVTNSFPDKTAFLWWYVLEDILQKNKYIVLSTGEKFVCETKEEKETIFLQLRELILKLNQDKLIENFKNLFCNYEFDNMSYNEKLCLTWNKIYEMSNSNYCTIAAHTINHKTLNQLTEAKLEHEILNGKKILEDRIEKPVKHFSYPFGTLNEIGNRESEFIKKCNFDTVCYAFDGNITSRNIHKPLEFPRVFLGELTR
jgi:peptidoglycan/xylan/chitin deacetylase (PgdA/CDA1 family)